MIFQCPCGGRTFLRALRVVRFHGRPWWQAWLPPREEHFATLATCETCKMPLRLTRDGLERLATPKPQGNGLPPDPEVPKPGIERYVTPGQVWTRDAR